MAHQTENYNIVVPDIGDALDVEVLTDAFDQMDELIKEHENDAQAYVNTELATLVHAQVEQEIATGVSDYLDEHGINVEITDVVGGIASVDGVSPNTALGEHAITLPVMGAARTDAAGTAGKVPAPGIGDQAKFLRGDATWADVPTAAADTLGLVKVGGNLAITDGVLTAATQTTYQVNITTGQWSSTTGAPGVFKSVAVSGLRSSDTPIISLDASGADTAEALETLRTNFALIYRAITTNNILTVYATSAPSGTVPVLIQVVRNG